MNNKGFSVKLVVSGKLAKSQVRKKTIWAETQQAGPTGGKERKKGGARGALTMGFSPGVGGEAAGPGAAMTQPTLAVNGDWIEQGSWGCACAHTHTRVQEACGAAAVRAEAGARFRRSGGSSGGAWNFSVQARRRPPGTEQNGAALDGSGEELPGPAMDDELGAAGAMADGRIPCERETQDEGVVRESLNKVGKGKEGDTGPAGDG